MEVVCRLPIPLAALAALLVPGGTASAQPRAEVGFVGLVSPDLDAADLATIEGAVEQMLGRQARLRGKASVLSAIAESEGVAASLAAARRSAESGSQALDAFNLPKAIEDFGRALALYDAWFGTRLAPAEVARVHERRAQAAYALRRPAEMRRDFARAIVLQPAKGLDERVFAPDAIAAFADEAARLRAEPPVPPNAAELAEIGRRAGLRWVFGGEARMRDGIVELQLTVGTPAGAIATRDFRGPLAGISTGLERGLAAMVESAGIPKREVIAIATPAPTPVRKDGRRRAGPFYTRWYFWGGVLLAGAAAAYATTDRPERGGGGETPEDPGVTIVFEDP